MDNVKKSDKNAQKAVDKYRSIRESQPEPMLYPVDPSEGDIWEMEYIAWRNSDEYLLVVDKELALYAIIDGEEKGAGHLINDEYELQNDAGVVIDLKDQQEGSETHGEGVGSCHRPTTSSATFP